MEEAGDSKRKREGDDGAPDEESATKRMRADVDDDGSKKPEGSGEHYKSSSSCGTQALVAETWEMMMQHMRSRCRIWLECRTPATICDIPSDIIPLVLLRLPSKCDRLRMSYACRQWRDIFQGNFHQIPELPWLVMPSSTRPLFHTTVGSMTYKLPLLPVIREHGRFCGSQEGGWAVLAMDTGDHVIYSLNTQKRVQMPSTVTRGGRQAEPIRVEAAVLSGCPSPDKTYVVGAVVRGFGQFDYCSMAYWQDGLESWVLVRSLCGRGNRLVDICDVLYHTQRGCFIYLTEDLNIHVLTPQFQGNGQVRRMEYEDLQVFGSWLNYRLMEAGCISRWQYLAQSENEILRIEKSPGRGGRTRSLTIYMLDFHDEMDITDEEDVDDEDNDEEDEEVDEGSPRPPSWSQHLLPGRIVFAGQACSRVFERDDAWGGHTMFLDDRGVQDRGVPGMFDRSDTGKFSVAQSDVRPWPPAGGQEILPVSDNCPPIWWLH